jgi:hypothetical protein
LLAGGRGVLRLAWHTIRLPSVALLVVMEPVVCGVLSMIAVLGVLTAFFFEFLIKLPHFPFWMMLGISTGFAVLLVPYYLLIRLFSTD